MSGTWKSQRFDAEGSTTAAGILRQLGRPTLDEFTVLVREAAQNSWDARRDDGDVDFTIRIERIGDRAAAWRRLLLPGPAEQSVPGFDQAVDKDAWYLVISDRGTGGLAGPIRATDRPRPGERNDFVQFLRNVGESRDTALGGGTYGFGKGIFYRTSTVRTILADTQIHTPAGLERRFFGASLGLDFWDEQGDRYTGRHWWGINSGGVVDPLVGTAAAKVAADLGLPSYAPAVTGTSIVVLGADLGLVGGEDEPGFTDPHALGAHLASAMLWNLWPKFKSVARAQLAAMNFAVFVDGTRVAIPEPSSVLALRPFTESLKALEGSRARGYHRVASPRMHAGDLAVSIGLAPQSEDAVVSSARPFEGAPHHVARMRQAGLVVDYLEGPAHADPLAAYGGVFRATVEADEIFAAAEPPTHDRWNPEGLDKLSRAVVDGARRWVRDDLNRRFVTTSGQTGGASSGLGQGSRRLAGLVAGVSATAPDPVGAGGRGGGGGPDGGGSGAAPARVVGDPWMDQYQDGLGVFVRVRVDNPSALTAVRGHLDVVLEGGGRESDAPHGARGPAVIEWRAADDPSMVQSGPAMEDFRGVRDWIAVGEFSDSLVTRFRLEWTGVVDG